MSGAGIRFLGAVSAATWATRKCRQGWARVRESGGRQRTSGSWHRPPCRHSISHLRTRDNARRMTCLSHALYPPSKPLPSSVCSKAHHAAMRESLRPPKPFILLWAATAESRSKKSKMIFDRASLSTLRGMKVLNESLAMFESAAPGQRDRDAPPPAQRQPGSYDTLFSDLEELVGIPAHDAALQPTPAPFDHPGDDLYRHQRVRLGQRSGRLPCDHTMGSVMRSS